MKLDPHRGQLKTLDRLKVAVRGGAAEKHLRGVLERIPGMDEVAMLDHDGQPDFEICYRGSRPVRIECKNVLRRYTHEPRVDFQKTRHSKNDKCSRYYRVTDFDILAACLHPRSKSGASGTRRPMGSATRLRLKLPNRLKATFYEVQLR